MSPIQRINRDLDVELTVERLLGYVALTSCALAVIVVLIHVYVAALS